jgi:HEAT repeat protein
MVKNKSMRPVVRESALRWASRVAEREGYTEIDGTVRSIASDESESRVLRDRAIRVIGHTPQNDAFLRELYGKLTVIELKERVLRMLGESQTTANAEWVRQIALDEGEPLSLRERAIRVLGEEAGRGTLARDLYPKLKETSLKERVLRAAGEDGDAASAKWLRSIAENSSEPAALRDRAIRILGERGDGEYLRDLYSKIDDQGLRDRILRLSAESGGSENTQFLKEIALDPRARSELRDRAIRLMVDGGLPTADLVKMYDAIDETQLRDRVIRLLGDRGDRAGMDKLLDIAKNDPSTDLRRRAVRILSERGDTRVKDLVEEKVKR